MIQSGDEVKLICKQSTCVGATVGMKGRPGNLQETQDVLAHLGCCNEHRTRGLTQRFIPHGSGGFGSW